MAPSLFSDVMSKLNHQGHMLLPKALSSVSEQMSPEALMLREGRDNMSPAGAVVGRHHLCMEPDQPLDTLPSRCTLTLQVGPGETQGATPALRLLGELHGLLCLSPPFW